MGFCGDLVRRIRVVRECHGEKLGLEAEEACGRAKEHEVVEVWSGKGNSRSLSSMIVTLPSCLDYLEYCTM